MYYHDDQFDQFGWGHFLIGGITMLLVWAVIITGIVFLARSLGRGRQAPPPPPAPPRPVSGARELLDMRFAKGEVPEDEYRRMRAALDGNDAA